MIKVLFYTTGADPSGRANVGDRVILAGTRNLIAAAFGAYAYKEVGRWSKLTYDPNDFDLVVYAGMPQYGARSDIVDGEEKFDAMLRASRETEVINIGGGTPARLPLDVEAVSDRMAAAPNAEHYRSQTRLALRTTRDLAGKRFFDKIGMPCDLRPCPSFFSTLHIIPTQKTRNAIAVLSDDTFVTTHLAGSISTHLEALIERLPGYELTSHSKGDLLQLTQLGQAHTYFKTEMDAINYYSTVGKLAALRIHAGVPAWTQGADVVVGGFDARIHMFGDTGMPIPWVDLLDGNFGKLADAVDDKSLHLPFEQRQEIIDQALRSFVARLRVACPRAAAAATVQAVPVEGLELYPPEGYVEKRLDGEGFLPPKAARLPKFVADEDDGKEGCVAIPAGSASRNSPGRTATLPLVITGREMRGGRGKVKGTVRTIDIDGLDGSIAKVPSLVLPPGRHRATLNMDVHFAGDAQPYKIVVLAKSQRAQYGKIETSIKKNREQSGELHPINKIEFEFENSFANATLQIDIMLRGAATGSLVLRDLTIDTA